MVQRTIPTSAARVASWAEQQPHPDTGSHPELPVGPPHEPAPSKLTGKHYLAHRCPLNSRTVSRRAVGHGTRRVEEIRAVFMISPGNEQETICCYEWSGVKKKLLELGSILESTRGQIA